MDMSTIQFEDLDSSANLLVTSDQNLSLYKGFQLVTINSSDGSVYMKPYYVSKSNILPVIDKVEFDMMKYVTDGFNFTEDELMELIEVEYEVQSVVDPSNKTVTVRKSLVVQYANLQLMKLSDSEIHGYITECLGYTPEVLPINMQYDKSLINNIYNTCFVDNTIFENIDHSLTANGIALGLNPVYLTIDKEGYVRVTDDATGRLPEHSILSLIRTVNRIIMLYDLSESAGTYVDGDTTNLLKLISQLQYDVTKLIERVSKLEGANHG